MKEYRLERSTTVRRPLEEVFQFFSAAENLQAITPPELQFEILTPLPIQMAVGTVIDYRIRLCGIPFYWQTEIVAWEPNRMFIDVQKKGPYRKWEHTHRFYERGRITLVEDEVVYAVPGGPLAPVLHRLFVGARVQRIFDYREAQIKFLLEGSSTR
ncbi:MAG: CDP-paratose 2-epimerase [Armatimonadetes bacterium]|nr:MAG: CDP-paratose 2-epimerase [Armatimonadota bacterium]